tara:strand:- start:378 stop:773 length:396 start_codon:yes stop_codon:yes gene_type:complete
MANKKYSKTKLKMFKKNIESKLSKVAEDLGDIKRNLDRRNSSNAGLSQDSVYSVHMADAGTDSFEREKDFHFMNRESEYYKHLYNALDRIENGTFGVCSFCGDLILEERMLEVPNATKCVDCKEKEKLNIG